MADPFVGEIRAFAFNFQPMGWLLCNGQTVQISQYQALYALIGSLYGTPSPTTFVLPNLCGRMILGAGNPASMASVLPVTCGQAGGANGIALTISQIPSHTHAATVTDPGHIHSVTVPPHTHPFAVPCDDGTTGPQLSSPVNAYLTTGAGVDTNVNTVLSDLNNLAEQQSAVANTYPTPPPTQLYSKGGTQTMAPSITGESSSSSGNTSVSSTGVNVSNSNTGSGSPVPIQPPFLGIGYYIATQGIFPPRC